MDKGDQGSVVEAIPFALFGPVVYQNRKMTYEFEVRPRNAQVPSSRVTGNVRSSVQDDVGLVLLPDNAAGFTHRSR